MLDYVCHLQLMPHTSSWQGKMVGGALAIQVSL